jgi:hypothetical protein
MDHYNNGYTDILSMSTAERRFFLGLLIRRKSEEQEMMENVKKTKQGKGTKTTTIGGEALKNKLKSGEIPTQ